MGNKSHGHKSILSTRRSVPEEEHLIGVHTDKKGGQDNICSRFFSFLFDGSIWPQVFPFCVLNSMNTVMIIYLKRNNILDLSFPDKGHKSMLFFLVFLVLHRVHVEVTRYMEAGQKLSDFMGCSRETVQQACVLTRYQIGDMAKEWRSNVAFWIIILLKVMCNAVKAESSRNNSWNERKEEQIDNILLIRPLAESIAEINSIMYDSKQSKESFDTDLFEETCRVPFMVNYHLRDVITSFRLAGISDPPMHVNEEAQLLKLCGSIIQAYSEIRSLIDTPYPYPLVQMGRTFLYLWVFTFPCAMAFEDDVQFGTIFIIFFVTYGFVGLEYVYMEMVDPYGNDSCDFDILEGAAMVIEDIYITIADIDGGESSVNLRQRVESKNQTAMAMATVNESILSNYRSLKSVSTIKDKHPEMSYEEVTERTRLLRQISSA